jgi:predicted phosphodiesterase/biotin operon repressor
MLDVVAKSATYREAANELRRRGYSVSKKAVARAADRYGLCKIRDAAGPPTERNVRAAPARDDVPSYAEATRDGAQHEQVWKLRGRSLEELADALDLSPARARAAVEAARDAGYAVDLAGGQVHARPSLAAREAQTVVAQPGAAQTFAVISDLHFGSKYHRRDFLEDFVWRAYQSGVRNIFIVGDILDGCYRHGRWELTHHGLEEQAEECATGLPAHTDLTYEGITGNHDQTFEDATGMVTHASLVDVFRRHGREDLTLHGARGCTLRLLPEGAPPDARGCLVELWHPLKGPAYALSYKLQKKIEGYAPGAKPDFLFAGHWHQSVYFESRGVHAYSAMTFQGGGSAFGRALGGAPSIGGWIIRYSCTADGTLRAVNSERVAYYEDEQPRDVRL